MVALYATAYASIAPNNILQNEIGVDKMYARHKLEKLFVPVHR